MNTTLQVPSINMKPTMTQSRTRSTAQNAQHAPMQNRACNSAKNVFENMAAPHNVMKVTAFEFVPNTGKFPLTKNFDFAPANKSSCSSVASMTTAEDSQCEQKVAVQKYKTELCKNWIENNSCRYGKKCQFAHGKEELATYKAASNTEEKLRTKNCRTFYKEKQCSYGSRCMFRHEHRHFSQIARHFYVAKLYTHESLYQYSQDQSEFINSHETGVRKLPIFQAIHAIGSEEEEDSTISETTSIVEDDSLSFIEMEEDIIAFCDPDIKSPTEAHDENESLNTSIGSSHESSSSEVANKLESDSMAGAKGACFDIAA